MDNTCRYGGSGAPLSTLSSGQTYFTVESLQGITTLPHLPFSSSPAAFAPLQPLPIQRGGRAIPSTHDESLSGSSIRIHELGETMRGSIRDPYRQPITNREHAMEMNNVTEPIREPIGGFQILNPNIREPIGGFQILNPNMAPRDLAHMYQQQELVQKMNNVTEPIREPIGGFQILNPNMAPRDLAHKYQQQELVQKMNNVTEPIREPIVGFQILNPNMAPRDLAHNYQQQELVHRPSPQPRFYPHRSRPQEVFKSKLSKNSDPGLRPKFGKRAQMEIPGTEDNSTVQRMPVRPGWCSLCDVDCNTKEILHRQHVFGKKHQSMFEKLKEEVSGDGKKPQTEQPQQLMGWCSLCEVNCGSLENLHKQHMLGKKHLLMLGIRQDPQKEDQETLEMVNRIDNILGKRKQQMKEDGNMSSKKRQKLSEKRNAAQLKQLENPEAHLEEDGESKKCVYVDGKEANNSKLLVLGKADAEIGEEEETVLAKDDAETGEEEETVLESKDDSKEKDVAETGGEEETDLESNDDNKEKDDAETGEEEETVLETKDDTK